MDCAVKYVVLNFVLHLLTLMMFCCNYNEFLVLSANLISVTFTVSLKYLLHAYIVLFCMSVYNFEKGLRITDETITNGILQKKIGTGKASGPLDDFLSHSSTYRSYFWPKYLTSALCVVSAIRW